MEIIYIQDKYMQNVYRPNVLTCVFCKVNAWEILDDKSDMYLMKLLGVLVLLIQLEGRPIEHEL